MGENNQRTAAREGLNTSGAAGVQIADVSVDTETGIVKINRYVAVQDCGMIINPRLAESQIYGAHHHGDRHGAVRGARSWTSRPAPC